MSLDKRKCTTWLLLFCSLAMVAALTSCASGPQPPQPGTPPFYWASAKETYHSGDIPKTDENLQRIVASDNEFTAKARVWDIVLAGGMALGYSDLAESYDAGARMNRANPTPFSKQVIALRGYASSASLQLAEGVNKLAAANKDANITLPFPYPAGSLAQPGSLRKVASGMLIQDSEADSLQTTMLQRGVVQMICRVLGKPDDAAAAAEALKTGEAQVPREVFLTAAAKTLDEVSELYSARKLDLPNRMLLVTNAALEALKAVPEAKDTKALIEKIQKAQKKK